MAPMPCRRGDGPHQTLHQVVRGPLCTEEQEERPRHPYQKGIKGVIIPGDDGDMPFKLRRTLVDRNKRKKELDIGSDDAGTDAEENAGQMFKDLCREENKSYQQCATGMMASIFAESAKEANQDQGPKKKKKTKKKKDTKIRNKSSNVLADDSDDGSDSSCNGLFSDKKGKRTQVTPAKNSGGMGTETPEKPEKDQGKGVKGDKGESGKVAKGRKPKDLVQTADDHIKDMNSSDAASIYFGERRDVTIKAVQRYMGQVQQKVASAAGDLKPPFERALKQLQLIESGVKLNKNWVQRKATSAAVLTFIPAWQLMETFAGSEPQVPLECAYLWKVYLSVRSCQTLDAAVDFVSEITLDKMRKRMMTNFHDTDESLMVLQTDFFKQGMANVMASAPSLDEALDALHRLLSGVLDKRDEFHKDFVQAVVDINSLVSLEPVHFDVERAKVWGSVLERFLALNPGASEKERKTDPFTILGSLFRSLPVYGNPMLQRARDHKETLDTHLVWYAKVEAVFATTVTEEVFNGTGSEWATFLQKFDVNSIVKLDSQGFDLDHAMALYCKHQGKVAGQPGPPALETQKRGPGVRGAGPGSAGEGG